jgi:hypothetical protein
VIELLVFGWFMPGRRRRPSRPPELRVIRGGRGEPAAAAPPGDARPEPQDSAS